MKANELMIGDWMLTDMLEQMQVCEIHEDDVMLDYNDMYDYADIQPILLTPKILERNGFKRDENWHWCLYDYYSKIVLYEHSDTIWVFVYENTEFADLPCTQNVISYVHELQHALKLCGIDKEIEL